MDHIHYAGEAHRIILVRQGKRTILGWTDGQDPEELFLFEAYFGPISLEAVEDPIAEAGHSPRREGDILVSA